VIKIGSSSLQPNSATAVVTETTKLVHYFIKFQKLHRTRVNIGDSLKNLYAKNYWPIVFEVI